MRILMVLGVSILLVACSNVGDHLDEVQLETIDGKHYDASDLKGKITVVNVWATWCGSCLQEIPALNALVNEYENDTNVVFLALTDEPLEKVQKVLDRRPFKYQQVVDDHGWSDRLSTRMVRTYPQHIVIDGDLNVVFDQTDAGTNEIEALKKQIEKLK